MSCWLSSVFSTPSLTQHYSPASTNQITLPLINWYTYNLINTHVLKYVKELLNYLTKWWYWSNRMWYSVVPVTIKSIDERVELNAAANAFLFNTEFQQFCVRSSIVGYTMSCRFQISSLSCRSLQFLRVSWRLVDAM